MSERRGRRRSRSRYDDRYYDDDYDYDYDHRPRSPSLGRKALDKLENAMGRLHLDNRSHHSRSSSRPHHSRDRYYPPSSNNNHHHRHHHHSHRRYHSASPSVHSRRDSSRSRSRWERGIEAAVDAAAIEAIRLRREPGPWTGPKGGRLATAAISAGVIGAATEKRKQEHGGGKLGTLGSAVGGLVVNRLVNGPRKDVRRYS